MPPAHMAIETQTVIWLGTGIGTSSGNMLAGNGQCQRQCHVAHQRQRHAMSPRRHPSQTEMDTRIAVGQRVNGRNRPNN